MAPRAQNNTSIAYPLYGVDGFASGWFKFQDDYLGPEVLYGSWPPVTTIRLGGRTIHSDRPVPVKIKLLEPYEDQPFWCGRKQHSERVNLGEYHRDFGDVEVCYSFSSPQTHIYCSGYSIHFEAFENLTFNSYNAIVRVRPEHLLGEAVSHSVKLNGTSPQQRSKILMDGGGSKERGAAAGDPTHNFSATKSALVSSFLDRLSPSQQQSKGQVAMQRQDRGGDGFNAWSQGYFPLYTCEVPVRKEGLGRHDRIDYVYTPQHFNDCERHIHFRDQFDVGVGISAKSSPVSVPPVYPPLTPYEYAEFVFSMGDSKTRGGRHVTEMLRIKGKQHSKCRQLKGERLQIKEPVSSNSSHDSVGCCPSLCPEEMSEMSGEMSENDDLYNQSVYQSKPQDDSIAQTQDQSIPQQSMTQDQSIVFVQRESRSRKSRVQQGRRSRSSMVARHRSKHRQPSHRQPHPSTYSPELAVPQRPPVNVYQWKGTQVVDPRRPNNLPSWISPTQVQAVQELVKRSCDTVEADVPGKPHPDPLVYSPARLFGDPANMEEAAMPFRPVPSVNASAVNRYVNASAVNRQETLMYRGLSSPSFGYAADTVPRSPTIHMPSATPPRALAAASWVAPTMVPAGGHTATSNWHGYGR